MNPHSPAIPREFYLASHDYVSSPEPRKCALKEFLKGNVRGTYIAVEVDPPLPENVTGSNTPTMTVILGICDPSKELKDIRTSVLVVDILVPAGPAVVERYLDLKKATKIGVGTIHLTLDEALRHSPLE